MVGFAEIEFEFPCTVRLFDFFFGEQVVNAGFDVLGTSCHSFGGAVAEESFGELVAAIGFAAFFHDRQTADVFCGAAQLGEFILLVLIGLCLFVEFEQFLFEVVAVIAVIGFDGMRG
jgi:hypothetical protein